MNDKQKKLLLLGGSSYLRPVIREAHALGIHVITCDYLPDNAAHKLSDQYLNISILDKDAVLEAARELQIDGVMSFACDPGVVTAAYVAEKQGLPFQGPYESVSILQDKGVREVFHPDTDGGDHEAEDDDAEDDGRPQAQAACHGAGGDVHQPLAQEHEIQVQAHVQGAQQDVRQDRPPSTHGVRPQPAHIFKYSFHSPFASLCKP